MRRFLRKITLFFLPIALLLVCYVMLDPFRVIWHYDNYRLHPDGVSLNRGFVSAMTYRQQYPAYHYDSFIFGNSRSLFYQVKEWKKHLPPSAVCYHFSVSGGSIRGLYQQIKYIDDCGERLNNVLIVLDPQILDKLDVHGPYHELPPVLTGYRNWFTFHAGLVKSWCSVDFLRYWVEYKTTGVFKDYMNKHLENCEGRDYDPITNEETLTRVDSVVAAGSFFDAKKIKEFDHPRHPAVSPILLTDEATRVLTDIHEIFLRHNTSLRIVISPMYDQLKLNPEDKKSLTAIFGDSCIYDLSGVNRWTRDYHNYYDAASHYMPRVASEIMDSIYSK